MNPSYKGIVPYLFYDDAQAALTWYTKHFGFEERGRWANDSGAIANAEMTVGTTELWLDGSGRQLFTKEGDDRPVWVGVWVDSVDQVYQSIKDSGLDVEPPVTREFGVRMLNVSDPFGYLWGFMRRV